MNASDVTVSEAVDGSVRTRRRGKNKPKRNGPVEHIVLDRRVMTTVEGLLDGTYTRYQIISATEAVVR